MASSQRIGPQTRDWGGSLPSLAVTSGGQTYSASTVEPSPSAGPGQTMPAEYRQGNRGGGSGGPGQSNGGGNWGSSGGNWGSNGGGWQSQQQLQTDEASGQPVEVSAGVWVWPNGQPVTGQMLTSLNSESTVLPTSMDAENSTLADQEAEEEAAAAGTTSTTATTTTSTSWFDESTLMANYTNGQVVMVGGGILAVLYFFMKRR